MIDNPNALSVRIYSSGTTRIYTRPIEQLRFTTVYPGGIFASAEFFVPMDITHATLIKHAQRVAIFNGFDIVWEGEITQINPVAEAEVVGLAIVATGGWGLAFTRYKYNRWLDRRTSANVYGGWTKLLSDKFDVDQSNGLIITPRRVEFSAGENVYIQYITNGSSDIKRVKFSSELSTLIEVNPTRAKKFTASGSTWTANLSGMVDGNVVSNELVSMATGDYLYISIAEPTGITGLRFDFGGTVNANAAVLTIEYYGVDAAWHALSITDGTSSGGKTWAQDGAVTFSDFDGFDQVAVNGSQKFFYFRLSVNATLTSNIVINSVVAQYSQSWTLFLNDLRNSTTLWSTSTAGTGIHDITLSPSSDYIAFGLTSDYKQLIVGNGIIGAITDLCVMAENASGTTTTTPYEIICACVDYLGGQFSSDKSYIGANAYDMIPAGFVHDDLQSPLAEQMMQVGTFSASDVAYSVGVLESDAIPNNTYYVIYYEQQPALTDYDYEINLTDRELFALNLSLSADFATLKNNVFVAFTDPGGKEQWANSVDDALLHDTPSQVQYHTRTEIVRVGHAGSIAEAAVYGRPFVAVHKNLQYNMPMPIQRTGRIKSKLHGHVPVSTVRAGKRLRIANFTTEIGDILNAGLIFLISQTDYDDETSTLSMTCGVPDDAAIQMARFAAIGKLA